MLEGRERETKEFPRERRSGISHNCFDYGTTTTTTATKVPWILSNIRFPVLEAVSVRITRACSNRGWRGWPCIRALLLVFPPFSLPSSPVRVFKSTLHELACPVDVSCPRSSRSCAASVELPPRAHSPPVSLRGNSTFLQARRKGRVVFI